ncbi:MBOAT family protein [Spirulina subsalsa FACHB-351]|uniref:MBOAT family protein n=1 Tax=Spirulina subsalsa FACHB-351 TaxID=234711 RepID=A0ABT3L4U1_9CYAN|nr:MBOAT family O-acyltransferase [Spirulina subsalsa]MCW6036517.1 MBOAT family protein [Spirulina subsalsa FACHB-351]
MNFVSLIFPFFLIIVFTLYWHLKTQTQRNVLLLIASYVFYGWWDARFCLLILASSLLDFFIGLNLKTNQNPKQRRHLLGASLLFNLGMLGIFKYFNFFVDNFVSVFASLGINLNSPALYIILPVGISFYTFQTLSYTLDIYRGKLQPTHSLLEFLTFVSFFPQLVAGPIERAAHLLPQFGVQQSFDYKNARLGCQLILWGLFKKVAVADPLGVQFVNPVYNQIQTATGAEIALATVAFAFQIYGDFSGYSNIAIGTAKLFNIDLCQNFNKPYLSPNINEFWRRWHISLYQWFKDYVYIPLGGSRGTMLQGIRNIVITFGLSGLWHGARWTFVWWGLLNGLALIPQFVSQYWQRQEQLKGKNLAREFRFLPPFVGQILGILITFIFICFTWIFFRAETLSQAIQALGVIVQGFAYPSQWLQDGYDLIVRGDTRSNFISLACLFILLVCEVCDEYWPNFKERVFNTPLKLHWIVYSLGVWITLVQTRVISSDFIYFQF